jgi:N-acetylneuraminic acid mutarotase
MYVLGGSMRNGGSALASVFKFESTQGTWNAVEPMPERRRLHTACAIGSDIYVFGGLRTSAFKSVFKYHTETKIWSTLEPMPLPCGYHSAGVLDGNRIYIVGAGDDGKGVLNFDTASGAWNTYIE